MCFLCQLSLRDLKNRQQKPLGSVHVIIHEAVIIGGIYANDQGVHEVPSAQRNMSDDKKFWQQASVATTAGKRIDFAKEKFEPLIRWGNKSRVPDHELTLYYHTEDMIRIMKSLLPLKETSTSEIGIKRSYVKAVTSEVFDPKSKKTVLMMDLLSDEDDCTTGTGERIVQLTGNIPTDKLYEEDDEEDVRVVGCLPREVSIADVTGDDERATWSTIVMRKDL